MEYKFRNGTVYQGIKPEMAGPELERIRTQHGGRLNAEDVLEAARPAKAPLHAGFTWDKGEAAHAYNLMEARWLIREVVVMHPETGVEQQAFVHVRIPAEDDGEEGTQQYYQSSTVIVDNDTELAAAVTESISRLISARRSLDDVKGLSRSNRKQLRLVNQAIEHVSDARGVLEKVA